MAWAPQLNTWSFPQLVDLVKRTHLNALQSVPDGIRNAPFLIEETMQQGTGLYKRYAERIHVNEYALRRDEWAPASAATTQYGYEKDLSVATVALEVSITELMRLAGKDQDKMDKVEALAKAVPNRIALDLAHRITFATATTYTNIDGETVDITTGDSLALASASHTLTGSGTTYSTVITSNPQFSKGALETAEKSFVENTYNNLGEKMVIKPDTILIGDDPNTRNSARELLNATADITTSNSGTVNVYKSKYTLVEDGRIATTAAGAPDSTKAKYWALVASKASDFHLTILQPSTLSLPTESNNGTDISTGNQSFVVRGVHGICIVTARAWRISTGLWS